MATGWPMKVSYANGDVFSASDVNDITGTINLAGGAQWAAGKNKILNGAMQIDQRNNGATSTSSGVYTVDRFEFNASQSTKMTWGQNYGGVTPPAGFSKYLGFKTTTAVTIGAGDYFFFGQKIEGQNVADLAWGNASAKTITLSFYVYSSLTGTFGGAIENSAGNRAYPFSYTISAANTWERKTITIAGDTTGTWLTTNGIGLKLWIGLGVGSSFSGTAGAWAAADNFSSTGAVSVIGTLNATYYITGVQVEIGSTATAFQTATGTIQGELAACQRYTQVWPPIAGTANAQPITSCSYYSSTLGFAVFPLPVEMRVAPAATFNTASAYIIYANSTNKAATAISLDQANTRTIFVDVTTSAATAGFAGMLAAATTSGYIILSSEL